MAVLGLSDRLIMGVDGQLFGDWGEASFGYADLISPRVDSDISDYYYDYQDQVCKTIFLSIKKISSIFQTNGIEYKPWMTR